ncbi:LacI family DNA-binding transcriptional regulator [Arthrobacter sp. StoSoilB5]|jgi:LacI family transcriptional regulator|uniref:LacI family DNA-binding transcriptional regulator n=1 Tax=Arthrobacter sp. StoSoilB5 TaxID=2830992 RepID=UPI001CC4C573|nr:LacI family DNA-binding transcriptional regulator [Arthrobacter sp. StoSoilB5]BCW43689.1 LacI family transcriptional regulator [Arthrobacter sp. StoSoilB5]
MTEQLKRATISDVAEQAGVSRAAVSKVLRNAYGVSPAMRAKVEETMALLNYRPLALARGMRGNSYTLGVFLVDLSNTFFSVLVEGVRDVAEELGYQVLIGQARHGLDAQKKLIEAMVDRRMDGLLLIAPFGPNEELERLGRTIPVVVLGRHGPAKYFDTVASDDIAGSAIIVDHLVSLGHERISMLANTQPESEPGMPQTVRRHGYDLAMKKHGLEDYIDHVPGRWGYESGLEAGRSIANRRIAERPTALHGGADVAALGAFTSLFDAGINIPGDISLVGYDNVPAASLPPIGLTTVDQSGVQMGRQAAELLLSRIEGRSESEHILVPPRLIVRKTTAEPAGR